MGPARTPGEVAAGAPEAVSNGKQPRPARVTR
jgi:hypothetical protein